MSFQTDKLPQIIVAEFAIKKLRQIFRFKLGFRPKLSKKQIDNVLKQLEASLMTLKYSYLPKNDFLKNQEFEKIQKVAKELEMAIRPAINTSSTNQLAYCTIMWGILILAGIKRRMDYTLPDLGAGVDIKVLRVRNCQKLDKLVHTRAYDGNLTYSIVTNMLDVHPNINLAAAFLPPAEVGGVVSEAMYLGADERKEDIGTILQPESVNLKEVNAILHSLINKK
ncbi:MAG: hypothetical protein ACTSW1_01455 [Candidatus Hodarchaeales archaeon]